MHKAMCALLSLVPATARRAVGRLARLQLLLTIFRIFRICLLCVSWVWPAHFRTQENAVCRHPLSMATFAWFRAAC
jgi:hypothetical protein